MSSKVYFILSGKAFVMSKDGLFEYAMLGEGSYFGDISLLLKIPNQFSYYYNPALGKPLQVFSVKASIFLELCKNYPQSKEILTERAKKRLEMFNNFK